jgi:tetratricopeptide (TPR) repeat protein
VELFAAMSATAPVLLALDDLHWAAAPTLLLLRHLLRSNEPMRLLVVGTYRDTDIGRDHQLMQLLPDLRRAGRGTRLPLSGLNEDEVTEMVASAAARELAADEVEFARHLRAETGGHPFCVEEVLLHFVETGALLREGGRWASTEARQALGIPDGVREVVGQRLSRLPRAARDVLSKAAVIGHHFDVQLLAAIVEGGMGVVVDALDAAEPARLVAPMPGRGDRYRFGHALVRSCIYEELPTSRRRWLHRAVGLALERQSGNGERLNEMAIHFAEAAAVGEADRATDYARRAGDRAVARQAFEQGAAHYARARAALELASEADPELACDLYLAEAAALYRAGAERFRGVAFTAADAARDLGDAERVAQAALLFVHAGPSNPVANAREVALMEEALERLDDSDSPARARLLAGVGAAHTRMRPESAARFSGEAVAMARRLNDPMVLAAVLASHHAAIAGPDTTEESLAVAREMVTLGELLDDPETRLAGHMACYASLVAVSDIDAADAALDAFEALARDLRQPIYAFHVQRLRAAQALLAGRVAEGERLATAMWEKGQETSIPVTIRDAMLAGFRFLVREMQGRLPELVPEVERLVAAQPDWLLMRVVRAHLWCVTGRRASAQDLLDELKADRFNGVPRDLLWFETMLHLAAVARDLADTEAAGALYERLAPYSGRNTFTGMGSFGPVDRALALLATTLGRHDDAERHFAAALRLSRSLRAPGWATLIRRDWAEALNARDTPTDRARAHHLATEALSDARTLNLTALADHLTPLTKPPTPPHHPQ